MLLSLFSRVATRGLRHSAVAVWNSLPDNIRNSANVDILKRNIKTHKLNTAFAGYIVAR